MLRPHLALLSSIISSIALYVFQVFVAPILGLYSLGIPFIAITLGSIGFHVKKGIMAPWCFIFLSAMLYILFSAEHGFG
jgi:hypothetical protein